MQLFRNLIVHLLGVYLISFASSLKDLDRLKARVKHLETRLNSESKFRDEDFAEITERLDDIDKVLNATIGKEQIIPSVVNKASKIDLETVDTLEEDFTRLRTAFTEEKSEAVRFRREIPKIQNNLISLSRDVISYCKVAVNNTDQLLSSFETSENDRKVLQSMAEKVQQNSKQIENIEIFINNLYSKMEYLFYPTSCRSLAAMSNAGNGVNKLRQGFEVYCDQLIDGGGWVVFQRRLNGKTDFYRNWAEYKDGFGDLNGELWLGNEYLSLLTSDGEHELRIEIEDFEGNSAYAKYSKFKIYPEEDNYKLEASGYSGTAGDSLEYHNGMMFSTYDRDHDRDSRNCAKHDHGAWWYNSCQKSNLNGQYYNKPGRVDRTGITWADWKNGYFCMKEIFKSMYD